MSSLMCDPCQCLHHHEMADSVVWLNVHVAAQSIADEGEAEEKPPIMVTPQDASQATTRSEAVNDFVRSPQVLVWLHWLRSVHPSVATAATRQHERLRPDSALSNICAYLHA